MADVALRGATKRFGPTVALDDLSLDIREGEFFTLLGPSGCGKTTALRGVAGFVALDAGRVVLEGQDVTAVPPHRRRVGMVFQHYALFPHRTVAQNVAFGLRMQRTPRAQIGPLVDGALTLVRLPDHGGRYPRQLSGGEQQRVALARALVTRPGVLLLDEPLGALDKKLREHMQVELKRLQREVGVTTIYVTHDQEEALTMSDRIAVMRGGRLQQLGTPEQIYERPRNAFVADFIGNTNLLAGRVTGRDGAAVLVACAGATLRSSPPEPAGDAPAPGEAALVALRPEKVVLNPAAPMENQMPATVSHLVYLGESVRYHLRSDHGLELEAREAAASGAVRHPVGSRVQVGWRAEHATALAP